MHTLACTPFAGPCLFLSTSLLLLCRHSDFTGDSCMYLSFSLSEAFHHVSVLVIFYLPSIGAATPKWSFSPKLHHADHLVSDRSMMSNWLLQNVLTLVWWGLVARSTACSSRACQRALFVFFPPSSSWIFMAGSSTQFANAFPASLLMWSSGNAG